VGTIARYIGRDLERVQVIAVLARRMFLKRSPHTDDGSKRSLPEVTARPRSH